MADIDKLSTLLDDPEIRALIFGLAHVGSVPSAGVPGPPRLRAVVLRLADTTHPEQYRSWLSDETPNMAMTVDQVRLTVGDGALDDLALFLGGSPTAITWQLASVLPDLVDALSPGGQVVDADGVAGEIAAATGYDDGTTGSFGPHVH